MRLVTRADLDGLTSAVIITMKEAVHELLLVHPQEITDKAVDIRADDILVNLPYDARCGMAGSVYDLLRHPRLNHRPEVAGGLMAEECGDLLKRFFQSKRATL